MYSYQKERPALFTEEAQPMFLSVRDHVRTLLRDAGAFTTEALMAKAWKGGDSFLFLACVDRLVELGEIQRVYDKGMSQAHVYTSVRA